MQQQDFTDWYFPKHSVSTLRIPQFSFISNKIHNQCLRRRSAHPKTLCPPISVHKVIFSCPGLRVRFFSLWYGPMSLWLLYSSYFCPSFSSVARYTRKLPQFHYLSFQRTPLVWSVLLGFYLMFSMQVVGLWEKFFSFQTLWNSLCVLEKAHGHFFMYYTVSVTKIIWRPMIEFLTKVCTFCMGVITSYTL